MLFEFFAQTANVIAQATSQNGGSNVDIPTFIWKDAPLLALLAFVIFWQGKKLDGVVSATSSLAGEIKGLVETLRTLMVRK